MITAYVTEGGDHLASLLSADPPLQVLLTYDPASMLYALLGSLIVKFVVFSIVICVFVSYVAFILLPLTFFVGTLLRKFSRWFV